MSATDLAILSHEFSEEFITLMKNRMLVSFHKYGAVADAYPHKVNAVSSLEDRLREYAKTGNTEFLVDAANFAMIEFMHPRHPQAFFAGTDDDASPGRRALKSGLIDKRGNAEIGSNPASKVAAFR